MRQLAVLLLGLALFQPPAGAQIDPKTALLERAGWDALKAGNLYVNVHSDRYKGGEVRAQLQP